MAIEGRWCPREASRPEVSSAKRKVPSHAPSPPLFLGSLVFAVHLESVSVSRTVIC